MRRSGEHYTAYVTWTRQLEHPDAWLLPLRPEAGNDAIVEVLEKYRSIDLKPVVDLASVPLRLGDTVDQFITVV